MTAALTGALYKGAEAFIVLIAGALSLFGSGRSIAAMPLPTVAAAPAAQTALILQADKPHL